MLVAALLYSKALQGTVLFIFTVRFFSLLAAAVKHGLPGHGPLHLTDCPQMTISLLRAICDRFLNSSSLTARFVNI